MGIIETHIYMIKGNFRDHYLPDEIGIIETHIYLIKLDIIETHIYLMKWEL